MKKSTYIFALLAAVFLTACGGGGGGDTGSSNPSPPVTNPSPPVATVTNPLTGAAAPGSPTTSISGTSNPGAVVTAYLVNPDGSSGAALGTSAVTPNGGEFTVTTASAPTGWVRLVSRGGKISRQSDASEHPVESMELVTPFVTTAYNNLKISPVTDVAGRIMTYKAKTGSTLADAFKFGMARTLQLDSANVLVLDDVSVYFSVLKGSIISDKGNTSAQSSNLAELNMGIDRFGIMYDLPQNQVWRVIAAAGENTYPLATVNGSGAAINVGAWVNGSFDTTVAVSLKTLMNAKTLDEIKVTDAGGARVAPKVSDMVGRYIIQEAQVYHACTLGDTSLIRIRYPFFPLEANGTVAASTCTDVKRRMADFFARMESNNSRNLK